MKLSPFRPPCHHFCHHFENQSKGCKTVFENEPFQCSDESIRAKREKKRKGKKKKSQKNQMDLVINQGIAISGFTSGHQLPIKFCPASVFCLANRESAFINSLIASGSTYEITKACHKGELKDCNQCSEGLRGEDLKKLLKPEDQILKTNSQVEQLWEYCDVPLGRFSNYALIGLDSLI